MSAISASKITKRFALAGSSEGVLALSELSLEVKAGEFVAVLGPSGCGKSTLLRLVAALEQPSSGAVTVNGAAPEKVSAAHKLGVAFQDHALLPWLTVHDNIALPFKIAGRAVDEAAITRLIELVGLKGFEKSYPTQLSGGMKKRAALARLLAYDPDTLLMDEPFGALDAQLRLGLQIQLRKLCRRLEKTVIFVTHDLDEAIALADRSVVFTARPGTVKRILTVDLPQDRDLMQLRHDRRYVELTTELWDLLAPSLVDIETMEKVA
jgi:NitT/TauT family transport system ATP-binding protein